MLTSAPGLGRRQRRLDVVWGRRQFTVGRVKGLYEYKSGVNNRNAMIRASLKIPRQIILVKLKYGFEKMTT